MRKIWILLVLLITFGLSSFSQLRVANNFGKDLYVSVNGKEELISNKGVKVFSSTRGVRTIWLDCRLADGTKFTVAKDVSRSGLVEIMVGDNSVSSGTTNQSISANQSTGGSVNYTAPVYSNSATAYSDAINDLSGKPSSYTDVDAINNSSNNSSGVSDQSSLNAILKGGNTSTPSTNYQSTVTVSQAYTPTNTVSAVVNQPVIVSGEALRIEYAGTKTLKIISSEGQGLELLGSVDSVNNKSGAKNSYTIFVRKNADLVIGVGEKKQANQAIWPYGEIRKRVNSGDAVCRITDADVKMMSTSETKKLRLKVDAKGYKILVEPDSGDLISLAYQGVSRAVELPVGQSYIRIAYTDPQGVFHPTAFMSVHVTSQDKYISITANDLAKTFTINNW